MTTKLDQEPARKADVDSRGCKPDLVVPSATGTYFVVGSL